ncbi:hypothetical protein BVG16_05145 [Paenibacillus selenitireducens]|uniref:Uncharacterized protein n=1 Tax=Paenibacillus selenitireducens TaxID=1324314 RepID=A0A1T2XKC3_9BACL|nr:hypothetical protein BVG16_05145 [Paenibacillus selenitireducens]
MSQKAISRQSELPYKGGQSVEKVQRTFRNFSFLKGHFHPPSKKEGTEKLMFLLSIMMKFAMLYKSNNFNGFAYI